jgi:exodeoxyribonuclease V alpha subunit
VPTDRAPAPPEPEVTLDGTVERITFYNPTNGFSVVRLRVRGRREPITVVGTLPAAQPGELLALRGRWQTDPRHGAQFRPATAEVRRPSDVDGIVRYLGSGLVRQIGPVLAKRIVGTFGERTLDVLDATPDRVREVPGIGPQRARGIAAAWAEHRALRDVMAFLAEHGLDTRFAPRLLAAYGTDAPRILSANPYRLVADVPGLGFPSADRLGKDRGVRHTAPARVQAAVQAALLAAGQNGHTRLLRPALVEVASTIADVPPELAESGVAQLLAGGTIAVRSAPRSPYPPTASILPTMGPRIPTASQGGGGDGSLPPSPTHGGGGEVRGRVRIYGPADLSATPTPAPPADDARLGIGLAGLVRAEEDLASRLLGLSRRPGLPARRVDRWLSVDREARGLSDEQRQAVATAATRGCFVLTGGPGVGKTTTIRALVRCLQALGRSVALAAPTGKAARRLGEVVGLEARTLHRLLGAGSGGFRHNADDPLPFDVVIVDEASMLDTQLARAVVRAVGPGSQLILVGDADQLPSVGPGQVLRDVLASGRVPSARLETVFRQAALSQIVTNAHRIRQGLLPELAPSSALMQTVGGRLRPPPPGPLPSDLPWGPSLRASPRRTRERGGPGGSDCVFVAAPASRVATVAAEWAADRLPRLLGVPVGEVQAIAPLVRVCQTLNSVLQARLNPARGQGERPHGALPLRVGDRVIQTHNNYLLGVFNGDTGTIVEIGPSPLDSARGGSGAVPSVARERAPSASSGQAGGTGLTVDFGDGRVVVYGAADLLDLDHAYGLTVHRAQGSEWPGVVVLASSSFGPILSRNLLYTALTRARRAVVVVGDQAAIAEAVARTRDQERVTGLPVLLEAGVREAPPPDPLHHAYHGAPDPHGAAAERGSPTARCELAPSTCGPLPSPSQCRGDMGPHGRSDGGVGGGASFAPSESPWGDDREEQEDAPRAQFVDEGTIYDPMPDDWPD